MIGETVSEMLDHVPARNTVECVIRPIALGRKNHLFAGSDGGAERWAIATSLLGQPSTVPRCARGKPDIRSGSSPPGRPGKP